MEQGAMTEWNLGTSGLRIEREGPIVWCIIDRPHARNAFTPSMYMGLKRAVRLLNADDEARAMIITGTGDVFAPGGDLGGRYEPGDEPVPPGFTHELLPFVAIRESQAPIIAAVNGICQAGGLLVAMMADATYAAVLPVHIGMAAARDLMLSCRGFDAAEAQRLGLISRVVPHDELRAEALRAAVQILKTAPEARAHTKRMLNAHYPHIDYETMFWSLMDAREPREGMAAFMEKRQPSWVPDGLPEI